MHSAHYDIKELGNQKRAIYMTAVQYVQKNLYHPKDECSDKKMKHYTFTTQTIPYRTHVIEHLYVGPLVSFLYLIFYNSEFMLALRYNIEEEIYFMSLSFTPILFLY